MTETTALPPTQNPSTPLFVRPREGRILAGVCAGIAERWQLDVTLVRIVTAVLALASGVGAVAYLVAWLLTPSVDGPAPLASDSSLAASMGRHSGVWRRLAKVAVIVVLAAILLGTLHSLWFGIPIGLVIVAAVAALLFGTRAGRWVFASLAVLLVLALTTVGVFGTHFGGRSFHVTSVEDLRSNYDYGVGRVALDLSALNVTGRHHTDVRLGRGDVTVTVPSDATVLVHAQSGVGSVTVDGHRVDGFDAEQTELLGTRTDSDADRLELDIRVGAGAVDVRTS